MISEEHRQRIEKYMTGIVNHHDCKLYAIYANPEHVHFLVSRDQNMNEKHLANLVADASCHFINENKLCLGNFEWQDSCSAFSVSKGDVDKVYKYILGQKEHHHNQTFAEEYEEFLKFYQTTQFNRRG